MKSAISKVTGLQVGFTTEWVVLDNGVWRALDTAEKALIETEFTLEEALRLEVEAKASKELALTQIIVTTTSGKVFDGRDKDRARMNEALAASTLLGLTETQWKMADNSVQTITVDELKEALALSIQAVGAIIVGAFFQ